MDCYCISGLGADHRIFSRLDLPGVDLRPLPWLTPVPYEPIAEYADRMRAGIDGGQPVLLGVSFGGMMAIEIARKLPGAVVIIVSSVRDHQQMPFWIKAGGRVYPHWLIPRLRRPRWRPGFLEDYFLGVETDADRQLVREFRNTVDQAYLDWSVWTIARWRNLWTPPSFYHIHGGRDRMFPLRKVQATQVIPDGGHLMIHNRAGEVSRALRDILRLC
ncbi:MAG TPA: alpha/beta hydrolase [Puia sp.]|nr:alpha/beta hydrolase [Puia sp.]